MNVSLKWLKQFVDIDEFSPEELAEKITVTGVEIEEIKYLAQGSNLVVGKVLECEAHPDSDHLHVCKVDIGSEVSQIVCGAPNVAKGQKVIVSLPGAILPAKGITIQKGCIRGVESNGMICSLVELGVDKKFLSEESINGIEVLGEDAVVGDKNPLGYLGLDDVIFELKPTPNRGDVLSMLSFAYEVAAATNKTMKYNLDPIKFDKLAKNEYKVSSETDKCHYFSIRGVKGVKIKESPKWLQQILTGCNIRSINNIVDIGNYVMLLTGQPLHMYDADKLSNKEFVVKDNFTGKFTALDDKEYDVEDKDLVITNNNVVSCLAGVMGGANTEVTPSTTSLAIEAAIFDSIQIRKTSTRLDLISDSSTRFVRGVDESRSIYALDLAAKLLVELADAKVVEEIVSYGAPIVNKQPITLTLARVNNLLGTEFSIDQVKECFDRLSFEYSLKGEEFTVIPPSYRKDIVASEDLVEEVIRLLGFDNLKTTYPITSNVGELTLSQKLKNKIRNHLLANGINEGLSYTLVSSKYIDDFNTLEFSKKETVGLLHPLTEEHAYCRKSLIPSLLLASNYNYYHNNNNVKLFEISKVYTTCGIKEYMGIILTGTMIDSSWKGSRDEAVNFYHIKGIVTSLLSKLGIDENRYSLVRVEEDNPYYHPGCSCYIKTGSKIWGVMGKIHPLMAKKYDVLDTVVAELDMDYIYEIKTSALKFSEPSIYPSVSRDISLVVEDNVESSLIIKSIKKLGKGLVSDCFVFDEYKGEHINQGYKSLSFRIIYHDDNATLKDDIVNSTHQNIVEEINRQFNSSLRA